MILSAHALGAAESVRADAPVVTSYSANPDNLDHDICWDIAQDPTGVLYFGSTSLLSFDGERWTSSPVPNAFAIRRLQRGPAGRIWAAATTDLGWFERDDSGRWQFHSLRPQLPPMTEPMTELWGVSADRDGATFVTQDKILRWNGSAFTVWSKPSSRRLSGMHTAGRFFVHAFAEGIYEVDAQGPRLLLPRTALPDALIVWLEQTPGGWLLGTGAGLFTVDATGLHPFAPALTPFIAKHRLTNIARLPDGRLAVGSLSGGLALVTPAGDIELVLDNTSGLPSNYVTSLRVGRDGELWLGTGAGIVSVNVNRRSTLFEERAGLPRGTYRRIAKAGESVIVAGEPNLFALDSGTAAFRSVPEISGRWKEIRPAGSGLLLAGSRGVWRWEQSRLTQMYQSEYDVFTTLESRHHRGEILLADNRSIVALAPNGTRRTVVDQLPDNVVSLAEDATGQLWMGTLASGVLTAGRTLTDVVAAHPPAPTLGLPALRGQTSVRAFSNGAIVVFGDRGAWIKHPNSAAFLPVSGYPPRAHAAISLLTADNALWVAHANTAAHAPVVGRISLTAAGAVWQAHAIDELGQIGALRSLLADVDANGRTTLWVGGTRSVLRHQVGEELSVPIPSAPLVNAFAITAAGVRQPVRDALPYATRGIEFEFAAPDYLRRSQLRLESRIDGVDADWIPDKGEAGRALTALRDGQYTIRVRVLAETGHIGPETTFSFQVLRPWWRTFPAIAGSVVLIAASVAGVSRWRMRQLQRRNAELEKKVRDRTEELEHANAAKTDFVANMSHDIRNPLNGIVGLAVALENTRLDTPQREMVATLRECSTYLSSLVDDVLDFATIEAGKIELRPQPFSPEELLRSVVVTMKAQATAAAAQLHVEVDATLPPRLLGDAGRIQQILVNFLSNAVKYAGGEIRLTASRPLSAPDEIELAVSDSGKGLTAEEQTSLFTKFSRLDRDRNDRVPGTGLGLAACRLLADIMGGAVGVTSAPGTGSRFFLRLPLIVAAPESIVPLELTHRTVLLVEDTDYNAWAATAVLAKLGLACERARTGAEALQLFAEKRFNVVMLDCNLPDLDGLEVARRMRAQEANGSPALLLAVTAYCTAADRERCLAAGMDAFVGKPITPEKIRRVLIEAGRRLLATATADLADRSTKPTDVTLLNYLSDGTAEGLEAQVEKFVASLAVDFTAAEAAQTAGNFSQLATSAHRLHGHAKMVGGEQLAEASQRLEAAARAETTAECRARLTEVRRELDVLTAALRQSQPAAMPG